MKGHESASILTDEPIEGVVNGAVTMTGPAPTTEFPLTGPERQALRRAEALELYFEAPQPSLKSVIRRFEAKISAA